MAESGSTGGNGKADDLILFDDTFFATDDLEYKVIPVPEWKGSVRLASLTGDQLIAWAEANSKDDGARNESGTRILIMSIVDAENKRVGSEAMIKKMLKRNAGIVTRLIDEAMMLNGLRPKKVEALKNVSGEANSIASPIV